MWRKNKEKQKHMWRNKQKTNKEERNHKKTNKNQKTIWRNQHFWPKPGEHVATTAETLRNLANTWRRLPKLVDTMTKHP